MTDLHPGSLSWFRRPSFSPESTVLRSGGRWVDQRWFRWPFEGWERTFPATEIDPRKSFSVSAEEGGTEQSEKTTKNNYSKKNRRLRHPSAVFCAR